MVNFYKVNDEKVYVFILTLKENSNWRKENVLKNTIHNPNINICHAIDGSDEKLVKKIIKDFCIFLPKRDPEWSRFRLGNYGRLGRWLSTIMLMKYSIDMNRKIIVMEDDMLIPSNFDFEFEKYIHMEKNGVLGEWGDAYFFTPEACKRFFRDYLYKEGIIHNDDNAIIKEFKDVFFWKILSRENYEIPMEERGKEVSSLHHRKHEIDFYNIPPGVNIVLLDKVLFTNDEESIQHQFTNYDDNFESIEK